MSNRKKFLCLDCVVDTGKIGEHYMLNNDVWYTVMSTDKGMLCIGCIENRLNRKLVSSDFNSSHVNRLSSCGFKSMRLMDRLGYGQ